MRPEQWGGELGGVNRAQVRTGNTPDDAVPADRNGVRYPCAGVGLINQRPPWERVWLPPSSSSPDPIRLLF